jgi:hypothetical protein
MSPRSPHIVVVSLGALVALAFSAIASSALAAPPYVERDITLPRHDWAFDIGLGAGFDTRPASHSGVGFNLEMAVGLTQHIELGFRTGLRAGDNAGITRADEYGRLFDRETFDTGGANGVANPEARLRGALLRGGPVEVALEGRIALPVENGTRFGAEFGVPLAFHAGNSVRVDTGAFIPVVFYDPTRIGFHVPIAVWFQPTSTLWLGPLGGLRFTHQGPVGPAPQFDRTDLELGFGLGVSITRSIDFKTQFLMRRLNDDGGPRDYGIGAGLQFRIE